MRDWTPIVDNDNQPRREGGRGVHHPPRLTYFALQKIGLLESCLNQSHSPQAFLKKSSFIWSNKHQIPNPRCCWSINQGSNPSPLKFAGRGEAFARRCRFVATDLNANASPQKRGVTPPRIRQQHLRNRSYKNQVRLRGLIDLLHKSIFAPLGRVFSPRRSPPAPLKKGGEFIQSPPF